MSDKVEIPDEAAALAAMRPGTVIRASVERWSVAREWPKDTSSVFLQLDEDGYWNALENDPAAPFTVVKSCWDSISVLDVIYIPPASGGLAALPVCENCESEHYTCGGCGVVVDAVAAPRGGRAVDRQVIEPSLESLHQAASALADLWHVPIDVFWQTRELHLGILRALVAALTEQPNG